MITQEKESTNIWEIYSRTKDVSLRNRILLKYDSLVKHVVYRLIPNYNSYASDYGDLVSYGILGLIDAIEKYDVSFGVKFETYACIRIRGSIINSLRKQDWISADLWQKIKKVKNAFDMLEIDYGRPATECEVAGYLNIGIKDVQKALADLYLSNIIYFDQLISNSMGLDLLADREDLPERTIEKREMRRILIRHINRLSKRERTVISLYYFEDLTLKEIGGILGVSESRVSQIHTKTLLKLRKGIGLEQNGGGGD